MQISALKSQKTSGDLSNLYVNDWEKRGRIRTVILYLVSHHFQRLDWGPTELRKWSQLNEAGFRSLTRPQDLKNQRWSIENWRHYSENLRDSSLYFFYVG